MTHEEKDAIRKAKARLLRDAGLGRLHCLTCTDVFPWDGLRRSCPQCGAQPTPASGAWSGDAFLFVGKWVGK